MGVIARNWRVFAASMGAVVLVGGSYWLSHSVGTPPKAHADEQSAVLQAIATKDSTGDGLPDWEKTLYGIPLNATSTDYFHLGMTDGEAVAKGLIVPKAVADLPAATSTGTVAAPVDPSLPAAPAAGTLTDAFSKTFFTLYLAAKQHNGGADLNQQQVQSIAQEAMQQFAQSVSVAPDFKTAQDLPKAASSGVNALKTFATAAGTVFSENTANASTSEVAYLKQAVQNPGNDAAPLAHIASIAKLYRQTAVGLAALPVPSSIAPYDLAVINALARLSGILNDFTKVDTDPMAAMLAIQQYPDAIQQLGNGLIGINQVYTTTGVTFSAGDPGAKFVNLIPDIAASQTTAQTP